MFAMLIAGFSFFVSQIRKKKTQILQTAIPHKYINSPSDLSPIELEELAAATYNRLGYKNVKHTGRHSSTDGGVDVWMLNADGNVEIVQCKQLSQRIDRTELIKFAKTMRQQHAVKGHYWAPGLFTQPAIDYAQENDILLYENDEIIGLVAKAFPVTQETNNNHPVGTGTTLLNKKSPLIFGMTRKEISILSVLACLAICSVFGVVLFIFSNTALNSQQTIVAENNVDNTQEIPTQTLIVDEPRIEWKTVNMELYDLTVIIPSEWQIHEINRREEDKMFGAGIGHDCADYMIVSPDGSQTLFLKMPCEMSDGGPGPCPPNMTTVEPVNDKAFIYRHQSQGVFYYSYAGYVEFTGVDGPKEDLYCYGHKSIPTQFGWIETELKVNTPLQEPLIMDEIIKFLVRR